MGYNGTKSLYDATKFAPEYNVRGDSANGYTGSQTPGATLNQMSESRPGSRIGSANPYAEVLQYMRRPQRPQMPQAPRPRIPSPTPSLPTPEPRPGYPQMPSNREIAPKVTSMPRAASYYVPPPAPIESTASATPSHEELIADLASKFAYQPPDGATMRSALANYTQGQAYATNLSSGIQDLGGVQDGGIKIVPREPLNQYTPEGTYRAVPTEPLNQYEPNDQDSYRIVPTEPLNQYEPPHRIAAPSYYSSFTDETQQTISDADREAYLALTPEQRDAITMSSTGEMPDTSTPLPDSGTTPPPDATTTPTPDGTTPTTTTPETTTTTTPPDRTRAVTTPTTPPPVTADSNPDEIVNAYKGLGGFENINKGDVTDYQRNTRGMDFLSWYRKYRSGGYNNESDADAADRYSTYAGFELVSPRDVANYRSLLGQPGYENVDFVDWYFHNSQTAGPGAAGLVGRSGYDTWLYSGLGPDGKPVSRWSQPVFTDPPAPTPDAGTGTPPVPPDQAPSEDKGSPDAHRAVPTEPPNQYTPDAGPKTAPNPTAPGPATPTTPAPAAPTTPGTPTTPTTGGTEPGPAKSWPTFEGDPTLSPEVLASILSRTNSNYAPLFRQQRSDLANTLNAQAALLGTTNSGGYGAKFGKAQERLAADQGAQLSQATESALDRALKAYGIGSEAQTAREKMKSDQLIAKMEDDTKRLGIQTNADLEKYLAANENELKRYGIDKGDVLERYKAELAADNVKFEVNGQLQAAKLNSAASRAMAEASSRRQYELGMRQLDQSERDSVRRHEIDLGQLGLDKYKFDNPSFNAILQAYLGLTPEQMALIVAQGVPFPNWVFNQKP